MNLLAFLLTVLVVLVILYVCKVVVDYAELPPPIRVVALLIVGLICLVLLLNQIGVAGVPLRIN